MKIMLKNKDKYEKSLLLSSESAALAGVAIRYVSRHAANNKNLKY